MSHVPEAVLTTLASGAERADAIPDWPAASWDALREGGVLAWAVPPEYGGLGLSTAELLEGQVALGAACPTTSFILSQRESALRLLLRCPTNPVPARLLGGFARGERFATVGLSQLTTSRQHTRAPALLATPTNDGYRLDGEAPWVTAADHADALVLGANFADGRQALFAVPADRPGLKIGPPLPLAALAGSRTAAVRCEGVELPGECLLAGPAEQVLGPSAGGGLETSALAVGLGDAATRWLEDEAARRPDLASVASAFARERAATRRQLIELAVGTPDREAVLALRVRATRLALRSTQAALVVAKGAGFVTPHPVQRWARQAMFFLVWSCPRPAAEGLLDDLLPPAATAETFAPGI
jgi:alkylation response protein AidB-like acyl-CoA dehydrogenase